MFVKAMRGFFAWALEAGLVSSNPTEGVKVVSVATEGFAVWTDDDVAAYRARWPLGTHQRVAFEVLRETGLRRGDAVRVGRAHVRDGVIRLVTEKTGERVSIAVSDTLAEAIEAGPVGDLTFIVGAGGDALRQGVLHEHVSHLGEGGWRQQVAAWRSKGRRDRRRARRIQRRRVVGEVRLDRAPDGFALYAIGEPRAPVSWRRSADESENESSRTRPEKCGTDH